MPALTREFPGLLPWHFGGDPWLTWKEADEYVAAARDLADARRKSAARGNP